MKKREVSIFANRAMLRRCQTMPPTFLALLSKVLQESGFNVSLKDQSDEAEQIKTLHSGAWSLSYMLEPLGKRGLTYRRNYIQPFWKIEKSGQRWRWPIAKKVFVPPSVDLDRQARFLSNLRDRVLGRDVTSNKRRGYVYVPLQGKLLKKRSFQHIAPIEMIQKLAEAETRRRIVVALHPGETYSESEITGLEAVCSRHKTVELSNRVWTSLLEGCDYVVSENSAVALWAGLLNKPSLLCADVDFHHVGVRLGALSFEEAIYKVVDHRPDFPAFYWWFFQQNSINTQRGGSEAVIRDSLAQHGWPM